MGSWVARSTVYSWLVWPSIRMMDKINQIPLHHKFINVKFIILLSKFPRQFDSLDQFWLESCFSFENFLLPKNYFLSGNIVFDFFVSRLKWIMTMRTASPIQGWPLQFWHQWICPSHNSNMKACYSSKLWWNRKAVLRNQLLAKKKLISSMIAAPTS